MNTFFVADCAALNSFTSAFVAPLNRIKTEYYLIYGIVLNLFNVFIKYILLMLFDFVSYMYSSP